MSRKETPYNVVALKAGNQEAWTGFIEANRDRAFNIMSVALKRRATREDRQDAFQRACISVYIRRKSLQENNNINAYIHTSAVNAAINNHREERRKPRISLDELLEPSVVEQGTNDAGPSFVQKDITSTSPSVEEHIISRTIRERLVEEIDKLPSTQQDVIRLILEGMTHKEIAEITRTPVRAVKSRKKLAMAKLRSALQDFAPETE